MHIIKLAILFLLLLQVDAGAKSLGKGVLYVKQQVTLKPRSNSALSITCLGTTACNFNFLMKSNNDIIYEERHAKDNIYLIFHDDVLPDDTVQVFVLRGKISYAIDSVSHLPEVVKGVLNAKTSNKVLPKETRKPKSALQASKTKAPFPITKETPQIKPNNPVTQKSTLAKKQVPEKPLISDSFFGAFSKTIQGVVQEESQRVAKEQATRIAKEQAAQKQAQTLTPEVPLTQRPIIPNTSRTTGGSAPIVFSDVDQASKPMANAPRESAKAQRPYNPNERYKGSYQSLDKNPKVPAVKSKPVKATEEGMVISKKIESQVPAQEPDTSRTLGPINDRVIGGGQGKRSQKSAKFGMKAMKNRKPVAAWVEVFKNGTKQRVKTFYTSTSSQTKQVRLPKGVYMVRVSYRTRDSKRQKMIKNIHLNAGENINKAVAFNDGTLKVIVQRAGKPRYVKVVVYKRGTQQQVTYDFSSRRTGIVELALATGVYDVKVSDHGAEKYIKNVAIRAGKINVRRINF